MTKEFYTVKNKVTGYEYNLIKEECDKLMAEEPYNFEVIDDDYIKPNSPDENVETIYSQIVAKEESKIKEKTVDELKAILKEKGISIPRNSKKDALIELIEDTKDETGVEE